MERKKVEIMTIVTTLSLLRPAGFPFGSASLRLPPYQLDLFPGERVQ
jgi:hypothetical protein